MYMPQPTLKRVLILYCLLISILSFSQEKNLRYKNAKYQFSFFPGLSTNGLSSAMYYNRYSFNLTSGISAGNEYFELGIISNSYTRSTTGIQIAGFANIVGTNSYINLTNWEEKDMIKKGDRSDMTGLQFSGVLNFVRNDAEGFQLTGGFNVTNGSSISSSFAGVGNSVQGNMSGVQVAGVYNVANRRANGLQLSALLNNTNGSLSGIQIAAVNYAKYMWGRNSVKPISGSAIQLGLINVSKNNDGIQIGLINKAKAFRGTQVGIVNFYRSSPYEGSQGRGRYGTPIGLLNLGSKGGHFRTYMNDLFLTNFELATGNCFNCTWTESQMPISGRFMIMRVNSLIYSFNPFDDIESEFEWSVGYGFQQVLYNKSSQSKNDKRNKKYFISYGLRFLHLNKDKKFNPDLSLLTRAHMEIGYRIKFIFKYIYAGTTINYFISNDNLFDRKSMFISGESRRHQYQLWPSYTIGFQM